jgi:tRNA uridine 5-carboxymethylaminomethyl modification enzyme
LVDDFRWAAFEAKREMLEREVQRLRDTWVSPRVVTEADAVRAIGKPLEREYRLFDLLRRPEASYTGLMSLPGAGPGITAPDAIEQVEIQAKYQGYIERQREDVAKAEASETLVLPPDLDYKSVYGLSIEVQQRLHQHRPETLGQASRIQGVTPAAVSLLLVHLKKLRKAAA